MLGRHGPGPTTSAGGLRLPGIDDFHHLCFFIALVRSVHVERLTVVVNDLPDGTRRHLASIRLRVRAVERDGLSIGARRSFHDKEAGAHRIHPDRPVLLRHVVVGIDADSRKWLAHHLAVVFLVEETPVEQHLHFGRAGGFRRRLARFHPLLGRGGPAAREGRKQFVRLAGHGHLLPELHHRLLIHVFIVLLFFCRHGGYRENETQTSEYTDCQTHHDLLLGYWRPLPSIAGSQLSNGKHVSSLRNLVKLGSRMNHPGNSKTIGYHAEPRRKE